MLEDSHTPLVNKKKVITVVKTCHITPCLSVCILTQSVVNSHLSPSPASLSMLREDVAQKCPHRPPSGEICPEKLANEFCAHFRDQQQCREHRWAVHVHRKRSGHLCTWWHHDARTSCKQTLVTTWIYLMDGTSRAQNHSFRLSCVFISSELFWMVFVHGHSGTVFHWFSVLLWCLMYWCILFCIKPYLNGDELICTVNFRVQSDENR